MARHDGVIGQRVQVARYDALYVVIVSLTTALARQVLGAVVYICATRLLTRPAGYTIPSSRLFLAIVGAAQPGCVAARTTASSHVSLRHESTHPDLMIAVNPTEKERTHRSDTNGRCCPAGSHSDTIMAIRFGGNTAFSCLHTVSSHPYLPIVSPIESRNTTVSTQSSPRTNRQPKLRCIPVSYLQVISLLAYITPRSFTTDLLARPRRCCPRQTNPCTHDSSIGYRHGIVGIMPSWVLFEDDMDCRWEDLGGKGKGTSVWGKALGS
ncbi:hypothetical protein P153DRAFT_391176 [Dothidotthia symphoricarpi CBS 119687]|uniref:Uncharacterized protein n=1 Tax=Dothidotthia symphoricarpi CBS 119687 TaxID=1392245 RepID=A0A6A5ZW50_9PLEO|nr:uncharacterized protein P153DRAFT_391176 [Dothidotthia symphoricarpi CBS 119687]KAF2123759.1 hypothetical protein P153DRAFT_391176 [Dothidotthia symphoricarpi CBS 119687]